MKQQKNDFGVIIVVKNKMETLVAEWHKAREELHDAEARVDKMKQKVQDYMIRHQMESYEDGRFQIKKQVQQRSLMTKKMIPPEIWERYALPQRIEFLQLIEKKKN